MHTMEFRVKEGKKPLRNESSSSSLFFFLFFIISLIYYLKKIILLQYYWTKYYSTLFQHKIVWQSNVFVIMKMPSAEFYDVLDASCLPLLIFLRLRENMGVVRQLPNYELTTTRTCSDTSNFFTVANLELREIVHIVGGKKCIIYFVKKKKKRNATTTTIFFYWWRKKEKKIEHWQKVIPNVVHLCFCCQCFRRRTVMQASSTNPLQSAAALSVYNFWHGSLNTSITKPFDPCVFHPPYWTCPVKEYN